MDLSARISRVWSAIERWLDRGRIRFLCWGLLGVTITLMVLSFVTSDTDHQTRFGSLGGDFAGFYYAGKILNGPTPENLYGTIVGERQVVVRGAKRFGKGLELLVSANELHRVNLGHRACPSTQLDEELRVPSLLRLAQVDSFEMLKFVLVLGDHCIHFGVAAGEYG